MDKPLKIVLDTNLWISYQISKRLVKIDLLLEKEEVKFIFSEELLQEFMEVASRPKFKKYFSEEDVNELLHLFDYYGDLVQVISKVEICRDPKDNFLLALSKDSRADLLITGDKDLLELEQFDSTKIVSFLDFEKIFYKT